MTITLTQPRHKHVMEDFHNESIQSLSSVNKCLIVTDKIQFVIMVLKHVCCKFLVAQMPSVLPFFSNSPCPCLLCLCCMQRESQQKERKNLISEVEMSWGYELKIQYL